VKPSLEPGALRELWAADVGANRDIYVPDTTADEWQHALDWVIGRWPFRYDEDGTPKAMPSHAREIFPLWNDRSVHLEIQLNAHLTVRSSFFGPEEIKFYFNPNDIADDADIFQILDFVLNLGRTLQRDVHVTVGASGDRMPDDLRYDTSLDRIVTGCWPD
jgi:hypothetical protein